MPRATCRCGQTLTIPGDGSERVVCPSCGARVRLRTGGAAPAAAPGAGVAGDGWLRFFCPCGRRLKVNAANPPAHGKCPDCGRVVPVPAPSASGTTSGLPPGHPETPTEELAAADRAMLDRWAQGHLRRSAAPAAAAKAEAGLRVCPRCGKPVHLAADACRACGTPVPGR